MKSEYYLGVDVGSVSTNIVIMDNSFSVCEKLYIKTAGHPVDALKKGLGSLAGRYGEANIKAVGATGRDRKSVV